mgnify:CR=1 FL=1
MNKIKTTKTGPNYVKGDLDISEEEYKLFCDYINVLRFGKKDYITDEDILKGNLTFIEIQHNENVREEEFVKEYGYSYKSNCSNIRQFHDDWEWFYVGRIPDVKSGKLKKIINNFMYYYKRNPRNKFMQFIMLNKL